MSNTQPDPAISDAEVLAAAPAPDPETMATLRARLAENAVTDGTLDVAYRMLDTPVGTLLLAATEHGLVRVAFAREDHDTVLTTLAERISSRILHHPARLDTAAAELEEYFSGRRRTFDLALDRQLSTRFRRSVLTQLSRIGYGQTASYRNIAQEIGNPKAARAVGTACATNPLPLVIPCHRVVHSDHTIGSYAGGSEIKSRLLELETAGEPIYSDSPRR